MRASIRTLFLFLAAALFVWSGAGEPRAQTAPGKKVEARLVAAEAALAPGRPVMLAVHQKITPGWHTYWKNPGDSGEPTRLDWKLPPGFTVSDIKWPLPKAVPYGPLMNYGFEDDAWLLVELTPPATLPPLPVTLTVDARWLVCADICIPENETLSLTMPVAGPAQSVAPSPSAPAIGAALLARPRPLGDKVRFTQTDADLDLSVPAETLSIPANASVTFFADTWGTVKHAAAQTVTRTENGLRIALERGDENKSLDRLTGLLIVEDPATGLRKGHAVDATPVAALPSLGPVVAAPAGLSLWHAMVFALLGGLILNLMPCVLPILSLKALSLAGLGRGERGKAARHSAAYAAGVLASFAGLAALLVALKRTGDALGWGFQFQSPVFVLAMASLFLALGLSLSGVFRIGAGLAGTGDSLTRLGGSAGSFFTGALATVAATPCTAPFMGAAIGYALARSPVEIFAVLLALGAGFALPMVLLGLSGAATRLLPRPGPWMVTFQQILAFPLYATSAWLVWVLSIQTGSDGVLAAAVVLVAVAFASWIMGRMGNRPVAAAGLALLIAAGTLTVMSRQLKPVAAPAATASAAEDAGGEAFTRARFDALRADGKPVFLNLTAAWCITCKVNERVALSSARFREALDAKGVTYLVGDWTNQDPDITRILTRYDRAGVPLYLLYPARKNAPAEVLPQILTEAFMLERLDALPSAVAETDRSADPS